MKPLQIVYEDTADGYRFAHIWSSDGVFGHAAEIKTRIPKGTWLSIPKELERLEPWLTKKCGFKYMFSYKLDAENYVDLLRKE